MSDLGSKFNLINQSMLLVPSISVIQGRTIRLKQGDFSHEKVYDDTPIDVAKQFEDHGVSTRAVNHSGKKPREMLNLSYHEARGCCLLASLNVSRFNSEGNLAAIKQRFDSASVREYSLISITPH